MCGPLGDSVIRMAWLALLFVGCAYGDAGPTGKVKAYWCHNAEGHLCAYSTLTNAWANCEPKVVDWSKCETVLDEDAK
jgi:hypothetical protein